MQYKIADGAISAVIDTAGAETVSVVCRGRERLWQNGNGGWARHAPHLFPVCGNCVMTVGGRDYPLKPHGFAKLSEFTLSHADGRSAEFALRSDEKTREVYPFDFRFSVKFTVESDTLIIEYSVENLGDEPLYFSCGGHESFALDADVDEYELLFEREEKLSSLLHDEDGKLTGKTLEFGTVDKLRLPAGFLQNGDTLIFAGLNSRKVTLGRVTGEKEADVIFDGFENLLLWRPHGAHMICIEPWGNLPDLAGEPRVEFSSKKGVKKVEPLGKVQLVRKIKYY